MERRAVSGVGWETSRRGREEERRARASGDGGETVVQRRGSALRRLDHRSSQPRRELEARSTHDGKLARSGTFLAGARRKMTESLEPFNLEAPRKRLKEVSRFARRACPAAAAALLCCPMPASAKLATLPLSSGICKVRLQGGFTVGCRRLPSVQIARQSLSAK